MAMIKHKNVAIRLRPLISVGLFIFVFGLSLITSLAFPQEAEAMTRADAVRQCRLKATVAKEAQCVSKVNACQPQNTRACLNAALSTTGPLVHSGCRTSDNPQACNQTVEEKCGPPIPVRERPACRTAEAQKANTNSLQNKEAGGTVSLNVERDVKGKCGEGERAVETSFDFGCQGKGNPIIDIAYALVRFLSYGVGLVIAASIIYAGIQYSTSSGNAENTQAAKERILNAFVGLIFYLFIFAFVQYLVPGGLFNGSP